ncbi:cytochrome biogenesis protein [Shewanella sp. Choline-02u-19]|uniref:sulfite exporter TauE/SafE family protein n=1 Tax=unclassified Shewanella TaxID=196818 RepID=UPI000C328FD0|nr:MULTISPECIES: sulfite exporter TauE/SafE family protein [unclassified Shewanella]PKG58130.1 cytochrome biogenesis protein [Shewanella sp. GutDb-MelDb]PKG73707.1 cytochrome biogenesis protein [Shewanella sp. GutCb]PKH56369.1 cytochrome biogenesis protein [Shewanella sp. Bg11-22]PKI27537.1 cytochrome biogenesis protein [Shewanella sp. Choline-02u-19]
MNDYSVFGAFLVGIMGAGHCIGMCGGLVGALSANLPQNDGSNRLVNQLGYLFSYNSGRIISYTMAGALVGASTNALGLLFDVDLYLLVLRILAGLMMVITGLYIAQIWSGIVQLERAGKWLWKLISPIANRFIPIKNKRQAFIAGGLWGWLPCGLVYSMLTWAVAAGNAVDGAMVMAAFGLGTLPALLSAGVAASTFSRWVQKASVRKVSGLVLIAFGIQTLYIAIGQLN